MAGLVEIPGGWFSWPQQVSWQAMASVSMNAAAYRTAFIMQAPATGALQKTLFQAPSVTAGNVVRVSLQTLTSTGNPTGTLLTAGAEATLNGPLANTVY